MKECAPSRVRACGERDPYNVVENAEAPASWCGPPCGLVLQDNTRQAEDAAQAASMTGANGCEPTGDPSLPLFLLNSTYDAVDDVEITGIFDERAMLVNTPHMDLNMVLSHDSPDSTKYSFSPRLQDHGTSKSTNQRYAQAVQLISTLANEHHCDPPQQFDSVLLQAEQSIDFVANVAAWVAQNRDTSQTIAVLVTLGHLVIHLALKKYRQLRTEISYNPETDESMHGTNIGSSPCRIAVGNFEIRNLDTRQQVLEALIKAETVRAKEAATVLRQQFQRIMVRANQIGLSVDTMWTCLVEHDQ